MVKEYPHERDAFTQGFIYDSTTKALYEGTGNYGQSRVSKRSPDFLRLEVQQDLDPQYFGEGITLKGDSLLQLTWKSGKAFVYSKDSLKVIGEMRYEGEGWGLAWDGTHFLTTNGSASLQFRNASTFSLKNSVEVHDSMGPLSKLNELELVDGILWANVWGTDYMVGVEPESGEIKRAVDLKALKYQMKGRAFANVLNGIAYRPETDTFLITGKNWTRIFEIRLKNP